MNSADDIVILKPKKRNPLIMICAIIVLSVDAYLRFGLASMTSQHSSNSLYWIRCASYLVTWVLFVGSFVYIEKKHQRDGILKLTPIGLTKGNTLYPWHEVEQFGITGAGLLAKKIVYWNVKKLSSSRSFVNNLTRVLSGYDVGIFAKNYEIPAGDLAKMLNDWKVRYTGKSSDIKYGRGYGRDLTKKELLLIGGGLVLSLILFLTYLTVHLERNRMKVKANNQQIQRTLN